MNPEERLEHLLRLRRMEPPQPDLADRIIAASLARTRALPPTGFPYPPFATMRPTALAAMLVLGFAIGFGALPALTHAEKDIFISADDEGAVL